LDIQIEKENEILFINLLNVLIMAKPKRPKMLKNPKKPGSHTIKSMENYLDRVKYVKSENNRRMAKYNSNEKKYESLKNQVSRA